MSHEVRDPNGNLLFTSDELERALNPQRSRQRSAERRSSNWPEWMRQLRWPPGMVEAFRRAWRANDRSTIALILKEARLLYDAEDKDLTAAAAAIRHELHTKYQGENHGTQSHLRRRPRPHVKIKE